jgi:L-fuculose-phosphate aldolase
MSLRERYQPQVDQCVAVCSLLAQKGYVTSEGGNLSVRLEDDLFIITPTRLYKALVRECDMVFVDSSGKTYESDRRPTGETAMYFEIFRRRPEVKSIIHAHPPAASMFAIIEGENLLMRPFYPETIIECGPVPLVPYAEPLTQRLADNFVPFLDRYNTFLMENHGVLALSQGEISAAFGQVDVLEGTALSLLYAKSAGYRVKEIAREEVISLENTMKTRGVPFPGKPGAVKGLEELYF